MNRKVCNWIVLSVVATVIAIGLAVYSFTSERTFDPSFDTRVANPAYRQAHPVVLFDEGHLNTHTSDAPYWPLVELMRSDGYNVQPFKERFTSDRLADADMVVIVCARGRNDSNDDPAFSDSEVESI